MMINSVGRAAIAAVFALLGGCTTSLSTQPDFGRTNNHEALRGISYALPMLQYEIKASYKVVDCLRAAAAPDPGGTMDLLVEATATSDYVAGERYLIDYAALANKLKTTDFTIETHPSGTLKALNASAEDKTGDAIKAVVDTGLSAVSILSGNPLALSQGTGPIDNKVNAIIAAATVQHVKLICTDAAIKLTQESAVARVRIKTLIPLFEDIAMDAERLGVRATLKLGDANDASALLKLHTDQAALARELTNLQAKVAANDAKLSFVETTRWPQAFDIPSGPITSTALFKAWADKWLDVDATAYNVTDTAQIAAAIKARETSGDATEKQVLAELRKRLGQIAEDVGCLSGSEASLCAAGQMGLFASLETDQIKPENCSETGRDKPCLVSTGVNARDETADKGIFVREPIRARLVLCSKNRACVDTKDKPVFEGTMVMAPQKGQLRFLSFSNGAFQNNAIGLTLRADGGIDKMQYSEKAAIVASALASVSASAGKVNEYLRKREEQEDKDAAAAKAAVIADRVDAKAIRDEELAQLQYQFDKIAKEKAIYDQANPKDPEAPAVAKEIANENLRLEADLKRVSTLIAIKKAEAEFSALK